MGRSVMYWAGVWGIVLLALGRAGWSAETQPAVVSPESSIFDDQMAAFKSSTGANRALALESMRSLLVSVSAGEKASDEWKARADQYWNLMNDADPAIAEGVMKETLGAVGTSRERIRLLLQQVEKPGATPQVRHEAMEALNEEALHWTGKLATADVPELEGALRKWSFDADPTVRDTARAIWRFEYPFDVYPQSPVRSGYSLLAIIPAAFIVVNLVMMGRGIRLRKDLELEYASPGPAVELAMTTGKGVGYLVGLLALGAIGMDLWVIRGRAVHMSAGDLVEVVSLANVAAAAAMIVAWSGNLASGQRAVMRSMGRSCLAAVGMGALVAAWMAMAFYHDGLLGGHPGPELLLAAGGSGILACAGVLVAGLVYAAMGTAGEQDDAAKGQART